MELIIYIVDYIVKEVEKPYGTISCYPMVEGFSSYVLAFERYTSLIKENKEREITRVRLYKETTERVLLAQQSRSI